VMNRRMYDFLLDLVPDSMRGKEIGRAFGVTGATNSIQFNGSITNTSRSSRATPGETSRFWAMTP
jgi:hypothetical protein